MNLFSVIAVFFELINWKLICSVDNLKYDNAECHKRDWLCIGTANIYRNFAIVDVVLIADIHNPAKFQVSFRNLKFMYLLFSLNIGLQVKSIRVII